MLARYSFILSVTSRRKRLKPNHGRSSNVSSLEREISCVCIQRKATGLNSDPGGVEHATDRLKIHVSYFLL